MQNTSGIYYCFTNYGHHLEYKLCFKKLNLFILLGNLTFNWSNFLIRDVTNAFIDFHYRIRGNDERS